MSAPKMILVPTDFSEPAGLALDRAVEIALSLKSRITLLYVCPLPYVTALEGAMVPSGDIVEALRDAGRKGLEGAIERRKGSKVDIAPKLVLGDPRASILDVAKEVGADMIVMGTHGRRGLAHMFLGSTAEAVVRTSPIPVLTVRAPARGKEAST